MQLSIHPTRDNIGVSHENGAITSRPRSLKRRLNQPLQLRRSREFDDLPAYEQFVAGTVRRLNARCTRAWEAERTGLTPLRRCLDGWSDLLGDGSNSRPPGRER